MVLLFSRAQRLKLVALFLLVGSVHAFLFPQTKTPPAAPEKAGIAAGREMIEKGEYEEAVVFFSERLDRAGAGNPEKLESLRYLVLLYWYAGQNSEAVEACRKALAIAAALKRPEEAASMEARLAVLEFYSRAINLRNKGDLAGSNLSFEEAWCKSRSAGLKAFELKVLSIWSINYLGSGADSKKSISLNTQALELALSLNYRMEASSAENKIGIAYQLQSDFSHTLSHCLRALFYIRDSRPSSQTHMCLNNIAIAYFSLGDYAKAYDYLSEVMKLLGRQGSRLFRSSLLINLGQTFLSLARSLQSPEYYDRALECFASYLKIGRAGAEDMDVFALNGVARVRLAQGRIDEAEAALLPLVGKLKTDTTFDPTGTTLNSLAAIALAKGRVTEAEGYYRQALAAAGKGSSIFQKIETDCGLGRSAERRGDFEQAIAFYGDAIRLVNDRSSLIASDADRAGFVGRRREPYQALIDLFYRLSGKDGSGVFEREIYRISESFRARSFLEQLRRQSQSAATAAAGAASLKEEGLEGERLSLLRQLTRTAGERDPAGADEMQAKIRHIDDMLDAAVFEGPLPDAEAAGPPPAVSLNLIQTAFLPERTALVEYFLGDERSFLMCVTRDAFYLVELPAAATIGDSLTAYLSFLEEPSIKTGKGLEAARRIYDELLRPGLSRIPGVVDRLIILPDGVLFRLPFETLAVGEAGSSPSVYLNDRYVVSYAPSAASLYHLKRAPAAAYPKEALALAVPEGGGASFIPGTKESMSAAAVLDELYERSGFSLKPIPYSRAEVEALKKRLGPEKIDAYLGGKASEAAFKRLDLGSYRLIHLACHAISDDRYPFRSALVLAPGGEGDEDGFLQVSEMYRMRTRADLVVLSACQTGRGKIVRNEGVLGLPRVFFYMGARSVVTTLWPVDDKASALFMGYFYDAYFGGAGKAEALRTAKRKMAGTKYGHPYYWAAFTLTGEF